MDLGLGQKINLKQQKAELVRAPLCYYQSYQVSGVDRSEDQGMKKASD